MTPAVTKRRARWTIAAVIGAAALVAGCAAGSTPPLPSVPPSPSSSAPPASTPPPRAGCDQTNPGTVVQSYEASPSSDGPALKRIIRAGKLKVGVSADNLLFGYRNPINGQLEGFDIDMVNAVAVAIFGKAEGHVQYFVENFAQRIPDLQSHKVDMVADIMTITCARWSQIAFSTEYFHAGQQLLVRRGSYTSIKQLNGKQVCTAEGSTGFDNLKANFPKVSRTVVGDISDCMVLFQQGAVEGIVSDNTVVNGFAAQDPYAQVVGDLLSPEPYGLGFNSADIDLVRFVNDLLETMRSNGQWQTIHSRWLPDDKNKQPPPARYGRALP